jgi:hypothetical protein
MKKMFVILSILVIFLFVIYQVKSAKADTKNHDWINQEESVDDALIEKIKALTDCPSTFYQSCSLDKIEEIYKEARQRGVREGFVPVILVIESTTYEKILMELGHDWDESIDMEKIRRNRQELMIPSEDGQNWLAVILRELKESINEDTPGFYDNEIMGEPVSDTNPINHFQGTTNLVGKPYPVLLVEVPVKEPWQVMAWFPFGGWNACPDAEHMVSVSKYWYDKYGAVPAVITSDMLEFVVPQPINKDDCLELAQEQYAFCVDIVDQGIGTIHALADCLSKSTIWSFWWD